MARKAKQKQLWVGLVTLVIIILVIISLIPKQDKDIIKVGIISPLTGDFGTYGEDVRKGVSIALEEEEFENVEVIYEDACLPKDAIKAINKLVNVDDIDLISGVFCIVSVEPILAMTNSTNIMMVASVPDSFIGISENLFSSHFAIKDEAEAEARFAYNELGARKSAILYLNNAFGISYLNNFKSEFEKLGGSVVAQEALDIYSGDFRTPLTKIKSKGAEVTLVVHLGTELGLILKQAKELEINSDLIGTYEAEDVSVLSSAGVAAEGFWISSLEIKEQGKSASFNNLFISKYGESPTLVSRNAYDAIKLQINAFKECDGETNCINEHIRSVENYEGASGTFNISEGGTAVKNIIFKTVRDGKFVLYE